MLHAYTCEVCGRHVEELTNQSLARGGRKMNDNMPPESSYPGMLNGPPLDARRPSGIDAGRVSVPDDFNQPATPEHIVDEMGSDLARERVDIARLLSSLEGFEIATADEMTVFGAMLEELKAKRRTLDERVAQAMDPLKKQIAATKALFAPTLDVYDRAEMALKTALAEGQARIAAKNDAALAAITPDAAPSDVLVAAASLQSSAMPTGVHTRQGWEIEVVDEAAVPREFLSVDMKKIRVHVAEHGPEAAIPGVKITSKPIVVATGKR